MKKMKRVLGVVLAFLMMFGCMQVVTFAEGTITINAINDNGNHSDTHDERSDCLVLWNNRWVEYDVQVETAGYYTVTGDLASSSGGNIFVTANGKVGQNTATAVTAYGNWNKNKGITLAENLYLNAGLNKVRVMCTSGSGVMHFNFSFTLNRAAARKDVVYLSPQNAFYALYGNYGSAGNPEFEYFQMWSNYAYFHEDVAGGLYTVKAYVNANTTASEKTANVLLNDTPLSSGVTVPRNHDTNNATLPYYEVVIAENVAIPEGQHLFKFESLGSSYFYFKRLMLEKTGELTDDTRNNIFVPAVNFLFKEGDGVGYHDNSAEDTGSSHIDKFAPVEVNKSDLSLALSKNEWLMYEVNAPAAGWYDVSVNYGSVTNTAITVANGDVVLNGTMAPSGGYTTYTDGYIGGIYLNAGVNRVKVSGASNAYHLKALTFTPASDSVSLFSVAEDGAETSITTVGNGGTLRVKAGVNFDSAGVLLVAAYQNSEMVKLSAPISFAAGADIAVADLAVPQGAVVKVFMLSDLEAVTPLRTNKIFNAN